jgi:signal transduction histidine kinase
VRTRIGVAALLGLTALAAVAAVLSIPGRFGPQTTYLQVSQWGALGYAAGLLPVAAGLAYWLLRPGPVGPIAALAGLAWLAPLWLTPGHDNVLVSVARLIPPLLAAALLHVAIGVRRPDRLGRVIIIAGWVAGVGVSLGRALFRDPFLMRDCWENCGQGTNVFLVRHLAGPVAISDQVHQLSPAVMAVAAVVVVVWRSRGPALAVGTACCAALAGQAWYGLLLRTGAPEEPAGAWWAAFVVRFAALSLVAVSLVAAAAVGEVRRARSRQLLGDLLAGGGSLRDSLVHRLADPTVEVAYWLPGTGRFVDERGRKVPEPAGPVRTTVVREGETVAVITHRAIAEPLDAVVGPAARLAIDNERLQAETLARLRDLRASRARVVTAADASRRSLERDLHDGAQQLLLALMFQLRVAVAEAPGDLRVTAALDESVAALAELRELAHGIFPAILDEAGLGAAIEGLIDTAAVPVLLAPVPPIEDPEVRAAAYAVVAGAVSQAEGGLAVSVSNGAGLRILVTGAAAGDYIQVADRVGALGGDLQLRPGEIEAVIPCASL